MNLLSVISRRLMVMSSWAGLDLGHIMQQSFPCMPDHQAHVYEYGRIPSVTKGILHALCEGLTTGGYCVGFSTVGA